MNRIILNSVAIGASGSAVSEAVMLGNLQQKQSIYYEITGDGTLLIEYEASPNGSDFVKIAAAVAENKTKITGEQSDGVHFDELDMVPCEAVRFIFTETGGANSVTVKVILCSRLWD